MSAVIAASTWPTNTDLILDVARLYFEPFDRILDPTYGLGAWWRAEWRPDVATDLDPAKARDLVADFTRLPFPDRSFDVVAFDPPYVAKGGRSTSGIRGMDDRYGQHDAPPTPADLQRLIDSGLREAARVSRRLVLCKVKDYVSSGRIWPGTHYTLTHALDHLDLDLVDRFEHVGAPGPQPPGRRQVHARRNLSTLFVFSVPKGSR